MPDPARPLDVLLLDYNGVIVDDEPIHFAALRDLLAVERVPLDRAGYDAHLLGLDDRTGIREAFRRAGRALREEDVRALAARKAAWYAESVRSGLPVVPGVRRFVLAAATATPVAVVSGALRAEILAGLEQAGIASAVRCVVSAEDVTRGKPDPEGLRRAIAAVAGGAPIVRAVVLEDSRPGLEAARALGAGCVLLTTACAGRSTPEADLVWDSFEGHEPLELEPLMREVSAAARA